MKLEAIKPFVRFARYLTLDRESSYPLRIPLDARLFYTVNGKGEISVAGENYQMTPGACLILPSGTEYSLKTPKRSVSYLALNFDFNADCRTAITKPIAPVLPAEYDESLLTELTKIDDTAAFISPLYIADAQIEGELISIEREFTREYEYHRTVSGNILHNILMRCVRRHTLRPKEIRLDIELILDYVAENCTQSISNTEIAERFGFNANYISDTVRRYTGMSLHKYLVHMRIIKSVTLLETGKYSVAEVACLCGFSDAAYFSRCFKKELGVLPTEYVKTNALTNKK